MAQLFAPPKRVIPKKNFGLSEMFFSGEYYVHKKLVAYTLDKKHLMSVAMKLAGSYSVLKGTEKIYGRAFSDCRKIKEIVIPDSVKDLEKETFKNCTQLERIIIGRGIKHIPDNCFEGCKKLKKIVILSDTPITFGEKPFIYCSNVEKVVLTRGMGEAMFAQLPLYSQKKVEIFEVDTNDKKQVKEAYEKKKAAFKKTDSQPFTFYLQKSSGEQVPFDVNLTETEETKIRRLVVGRAGNYSYNDLKADAPKLYAKINEKIEECRPGGGDSLTIFPKGLTYTQGDKLDINYVDAQNLHNYLLVQDSMWDYGRFCLVTTTKVSRAESKSKKLFCFEHPTLYKKFDLNECYISEVHPYLSENVDKFRKMQSLYNEIRPRLLEWKNYSQKLETSVQTCISALDEFFDITFKKLNNSVPEGGLVKFDINIKDIDKSQIKEYIFYCHGVAVILASDSAEKAKSFAEECIKKHYPSLPFEIEKEDICLIDRGLEYQHAKNLLGGEELSKHLLFDTGFFLEFNAKTILQYPDNKEIYNKMVDVSNFVREIEHCKYKRTKPTFEKVE